MQHPRLDECLVPDFMELDGAASELSGYDACFYCAGVTSVGMSEAEYQRITYDVTLHFASVVANLNPEMTFVYVSGALTDSTEKGKTMWARVKGKTENALLRLPFKQAYNFRPGFMKPMPGQKNLKYYYKILGWLYPILHRLFPRQGCTLQQVALAMIQCVVKGYPKPVLEITDIQALSNAN
jgi:hypothetical protein